MAKEITEKDFLEIILDSHPLANEGRAKDCFQLAQAMCKAMCAERDVDIQRLKQLCLDSDSQLTELIKLKTTKSDAVELPGDKEIDKMVKDIYGWTNGLVDGHEKSFRDGLIQMRNKIKSTPKPKTQ